MKTTIVPAQVTTLEDTIIGKLSLTQVVILIIPVFISAFVFSLLPPVMHVSFYKVSLLAIVAVPILIMSIRFKGELIVHWLILIIRFYYRPHYYLETINNHSAIDCLELDNLQVDIEQPEKKRFLSTKSYKELLPKDLIAIDKAMIGKKINYFIDYEGRLNAIIETE